MAIPRRTGWVVPLVLLFSACGDAAGPGDRIVAGVNLTELFAPPTQSEISAALEDWNQRDVSAQNVQLLDSASVKLGFLNADTVTVRVVSHTVGGARHFGAVVVPAGTPPASLPILVVAHPDDAGIDLDAALGLLAFGFGSTVDDYVLVIPSFRSEPLVFGGATYRSEGSPSPWDRDVDDALALLNVAIGITAEADTGRIGVLGLSRGAGVALLMAIRDPRIDAVVDFFGPTDFFGSFVQGVVEDALLGVPRNLPGLADLDAQFIQPLKRGDLTIPDVRAQLVRRSPVYFVERLPAVQLHHGTADSIVPVSQAERLIEVMQAAGRGPPAFESYLYPGGGHDPFSLPGSIDRAIAFLARLSSPSASWTYPSWAAAGSCRPQCADRIPGTVRPLPPRSRTCCPPGSVAFPGAGPPG